MARSQCSTATSLLLTFLATAGTASAALNAMTYKGCFSSSAPLSDVGSYNFQSSGYCQQQCVGKNSAVLATYSGTNCYCGNQLPAASSLVDDSKCNTPCTGYGPETCGGSTYWSVYLSGTTKDVTNYEGDSGSSSSSSTSTTAINQQTNVAAATSAATTPSVITSVSPDHTVVVTISASASNTAAAGSGSGGTSTAGIAAGAVVGVVAAASIVGGIFYFLRYRRRRQAEDDYKRSAQVSDFMRSAGERKAPNTAYSQMSDSRLDPEAGRRNSFGSIADDQDYSRRILRVANPDSH